ncbi:UNVERIFIED_CONTAM: hypothetical protein Sradi_5480300 [Sesamum radiatum]|uniref:Uncharacterized protein n=1 Tax=Sesamum radiatum TaxID=300843 RepID=A0AAW2LA19_SESRA
MEGNGKISDYRRKLDKTLSSPDLTNHEILRTLVKNQILQSSECRLEGCTENVVERRSKEVSDFLSMLRSASVNDVESNRAWKVKQDTEELRVMYREGPEGSPFHTLLAEGYVDGSVDVCMCISWESSLYQKWTIASMDIKLDFVPPAIINFISRQLIGSGFKLYKKEVASVSKGDEKFCKALKEPLYARIREALYSGNTSLNLENLEKSTSIMVEESREALGDDDAKENSRCDDPIVGSEAEEVMVGDKNKPSEIEEVEEIHARGRKSLQNEEESVISTKGEEALTTTNGIGENYVGPKTRKKVHVRPEVEQALKTLDKVISMFRENKCGPETGRPGINKINLTNLEKEAVEESTSSGADQMSGKKGNSAESSKINSQDLDTLERRTASSDSHASRHKGSNSYTRDQSKIAPASPDEDRSNPSNSNHRALHASVNQPTDSTVFEKVPENYTLMSADANTNAGTRVPKTKNKKSRFCCMHFVSP